MTLLRQRGRPLQVLWLLLVVFTVVGWAAAHPNGAADATAGQSAGVPPAKPKAPPVAVPAPQRAKAPATAAPGSCNQCHQALTKQAVVHPVADDCSSCHVQEKDNAHRFKLAAEGGDLCTTCHEVPKSTDKFVHGPVAAGDCVGCHNPHGSAKPKLLTINGAELCQGCHIEMKAKLAEKRFAHAPVKSDCTGCHDPHSSGFRYQLKATGSVLCLSCHKETARLLSQSPVKHDAVKMGAECLNCHDPHAADVRPQLKSKSMPLCLACHDKEILVAGGTLLNIKGWLAANTDLHGPVREQDCVGCHRPHESDHFRLLKKDYPAKFYSPFDPKNYELCFGCHQPDLVRVEKTTTLTGFRDGDRNLHFVHVNNAEKGRTCRACHEAHSSNHPRHIRDAVPFGSWSLPVKFALAQNGGRCAPGCHVPREYNRDKAATKPEAGR